MKQKVKRKKVIKWLNKVCKDLPVRTYQVAHKYHRPLFTDPQGNLYTEEMGKEGIERRMVWRYVETHERNHKRMCLHLYDRWGFEAVLYYLKSFVPKEEEIMKQVE